MKNLKWSPFDLQIWRASLGYSKAEAARALAMSRRNYDNLENGRYRITDQTALLCDYVTTFGRLN